jgi:hypothetical protein
MCDLTSCKPFQCQWSPGPFSTVSRASEKWIALLTANIYSYLDPTWRHYPERNYWVTFWTAWPYCLFNCRNFELRDLTSCQPFQSQCSPRVALFRAQLLVYILNSVILLPFEWSIFWMAWLEILQTIWFQCSPRAVVYPPTLRATAENRYPPVLNTLALDKIT